MAENEHDMQRNLILNLLNDYCNCNKLKVNISKTKIMVIARSKTRLHNIPTQCWHVSARRAETERQKYFLPGRQKYLSPLVSPLWAETALLFTYTALFYAVDGILSSLCYKLSVG